MKKVIVVLGPTGVGKTAISIEIAKHINGEIISGDSVQIYKGQDIGSAKIKPSEMQGIKHHLIDILDPGTSFSVAEFQRLVREKINAIDNPIIVGGTGLYIDAAIKNYDFNEKRDEDFSKKFEHLSNHELYMYLLECDSSCIHIHENNRKRVLRALEVFLKTNESITKKKDKHTYLYNSLVICLSLERSKLYARIDDRVDRMIRDGLIEEAKSFYDKGIQIEGIGYRELYPYFKKEITLEKAVDTIKINSRHYAKKQITWFNNQDDFVKIDVNLEDFSQTIEEALKYVDNFLKGE